MMAHKLRFILSDSLGTPIRQFQFSAMELIGFVIYCLIALFAIGTGVMNYIDLHQKIRDKKIMVRKLALKTAEAYYQREQIKKFAIELNDFKKKLIQLEKFKHNICIATNIDEFVNGKQLFGMGGSPPEDLNPSLYLNKRHQHLIKDMHHQVGQLNHASSIQHDDLESLLSMLEFQKRVLDHTPAIWPVNGWISSKFGYRKSPFTGQREFHHGVDIANRKGSPVIAPANGTVTFVGRKGSLGKVVILDHGFGITTRYAHLSQMLCKVGDRVKRSNTIALVGNSGRSTGPHLHYEVHVNGEPVDPIKYLMK